MSAPNLFHKLSAETIGTFWLELGGVGSAVFSLKAQSDLFSLGIGYLGAALARRVEWKLLPAYWIVQVIGGLLGALVVYFIAFGKPGFIATGHLVANGYGVHSPTGYSLGAVTILAEIVLTAVFLFVILGSTDTRAPKGFAGLAIGLTLTIIHLVAIPISDTSVNPARSTAVAFFNGDGAPAQLWVFWLAPLVGGAIAGIAYPLLFGRAEEEAPPTVST
jgi:aquaporin Z